MNHDSSKLTLGDVFVVDVGRSSVSGLMIMPSGSKAGDAFVCGTSIKLMSNVVMISVCRVQAIADNDCEDHETTMNCEPQESSRILHGDHCASAVVRISSFERKSSKVSTSTLGLSVFRVLYS